MENVDKPAAAKKVKPKEDVTKAKAQQVRSLRGTSVSPLTGVTYSSVPVDYTERDSWVEAQIAAKYFEVLK